MKWEILSKNSRNVVKTLLKNRGIKDEKLFFKPIHPAKISLVDLGVKKKDIEASVKRINQAKSKKEKVIVYGDYDADGVCATAIMWETLYSMGIDTLPFIPDRFEEGYGINVAGVEKLKRLYPDLSLIVTVDNGIVANDGIKKASELGIDVIVVDHHQKEKRPPSAYSIIHSDKVCGSALSYFFAKELGNESGLDLATIGTIADQMPLTDFNRSIVKYGLDELLVTKRVGLKSLFKDSGIKQVGTYEVSYIIAPRINAMGRLSHAIDALRFVCTRDLAKAQSLSKLLNDTNKERQSIVEKVVIEVRKNVGDKKVIVVASENYHEGVIGLAAGRLVEEFYRPAIVISKSNKVAKASARSISGFNIIEAIRKLDSLILGGGGHPMAAGFSIALDKIEEFEKGINEISNDLLTDEVLERKLKIDLPISFGDINEKLIEDLKKFEPFGNGNYSPVFASEKVQVVEVKKVGSNGGNHLKFKFLQDEIVLEGIWFSSPFEVQELSKQKSLDIAYSIEENIWNNNRSIQLKVKDLHLPD